MVSGLHAAIFCGLFSIGVMWQLRVMFTRRSSLLLKQLESANSKNLELSSKNEELTKVVEDHIVSIDRMRDDISYYENKAKELLTLNNDFKIQIKDLQLTTQDVLAASVTKDEQIKYLELVNNTLTDRIKVLITEKVNLMSGVNYD